MMIRLISNDGYVELVSFQKFDFCCCLFLPDQLRHSSGNKHMPIHPSRFQWNKFKDAVHFYVLLGVIPLGLLVFCVNVFIGPAELAEIPEGYEPKHWEYYRHPIQQFFARYIYPSPEQEYEKTLHFLNEEKEKAELRLLEKKVRQLMEQRGDYKAWYYIPAPAKHHRYDRKEAEEFDDSRGY
ncbi:NADH dehydrogenase [ubiquinone] 1 beta subcomplex subunit 5, mitochondrial-like [Limulus polyphemus]|uniref:NADH dehydrogenase [ubiquinone] 1 beta subcomplex subunit 5, mitochondrial n=1 Tax=Limulus polyphemus TaxID=6850 RepID=A0ABM1T537_LIMPO|nr:NADH dehydrogenase [ubiquinone] 1 beta subcomplex subunit 5, mitochondrial-like [Limulus polyphemus]